MAILKFNDESYKRFLLKYEELSRRAQSVLYKSKDNTTLYKVFIYPKNLKGDDLKKASNSMFRKLEKLQKIKREGYNQKIAECIAFPTDIIIVNDICVGYTMTFFEDAETLNIYIMEHSDMSCIEKLELSIELCRKISMIHMYFTIGDCHIEQFMVSKDGKIFLIDTDTFGIRKYDIEAERVRILQYADPLALDNDDHITHYKNENDWYSAAIIIFKIMVNGKSAFRGKYNDINYKPEQRMKMRISVLHEEGVDLRGFGFNDFAWMSIDMQETFIQIFEEDKRMDLSHAKHFLWNSLEKQLEDINYCSVHDLFYSKSRYSYCPECCLSIDEFHTLFRNRLSYTGPKKRRTDINVQGQSKSTKTSASSSANKKNIVELKGGVKIDLSQVKTEPLSSNSIVLTSQQVTTQPPRVRKPKKKRNQNNTNRSNSMAPRQNHGNIVQSNSPPSVRTNNAKKGTTATKNNMATPSNQTSNNSSMEIFSTILGIGIFIAIAIDAIAVIKAVVYIYNELHLSASTFVLIIIVILIGFLIFQCILKFSDWIDKYLK